MKHFLFINKLLRNKFHSPRLKCHRFSIQTIFFTKFDSVGKESLIQKKSYLITTPVINPTNLSHLSDYSKIQKEITSTNFFLSAYTTTTSMLHEFLAPYNLKIQDLRQGCSQNDPLHYFLIDFWGQKYWFTSVACAGKQNVRFVGSL